MTYEVTLETGEKYNVYGDSLNKNDKGLPSTVTVKRNKKELVVALIPASAKIVTLISRK
jgi:hypothetical protein